MNFIYYFNIYGIYGYSYPYPHRLSNISMNCITVPQYDDSISSASEFIHIVWNKERIQVEKGTYVAKIQHSTTGPYLTGKSILFYYIWEAFVEKYTILLHMGSVRGKVYYFTTYGKRSWKRTSLLIFRTRKRIPEPSTGSGQYPNTQET